MPCLRSDLAKSVREFLLIPNERTSAAGESKEAIAWILKNSLHLLEIDSKLLKTILKSMNETGNQVNLIGCKLQFTAYE